MRAVVVSIVLVCIGGAAHADPRKPIDPETRAKASGHVKQAQEFFKTEQWDKAIAEYTAALELTGEPVLVFDIAPRARQGGPLRGGARRLQALPSSSSRRVKSRARAREDVARLVPIVDQILERKRRGEADRARVASGALRSRAPASGARGTAASRPDAVEAGARTYRWGRGSRRGGVALVALAVGAKFGLDARSAAHGRVGVRRPDVDPGAAPARCADGRSAQTKMIAATSIGVANAVAAGVFYPAVAACARTCGAIACRGRADWSSRSDRAMMPADGVHPVRLAHARLRARSSAATDRRSRDEAARGRLRQTAISALRSNSSSTASAGAHSLHITMASRRSHRSRSASLAAIQRGGRPRQ